MDHLQRKKDELEDQHIRRTRQFNELEWEYDNMKRDIRQHTEEMGEWVAYFFRNVPDVSLSYELEQQTNLQEDFMRRVRRYEDRLDEAREQERKQYWKNLDNLEKEERNS
ncbi:hypothetical protein STRDD11_01214 [Streptococcus sp. DD11]|uniref:hypothetical protein n=1 Tax=Streptococcus sp. DD11 TaxID=1777879 RepID=UPI000793C9D7|nr:hypothetical protein [Streptococcus sp. DD11]KXT83937.1 hypothetical protein STRDD11_01214 [Streptococcus sp. DD11]